MENETRRLKVLLLTEFFPKSLKAEITGGVEARCFFVSRYLKRLECEVKVLAKTTEGEEWAFSSFRSIGKRIIFWFNIFISGLRENPDIIEGTNYTTYIPSFFLGLIKRKPVVFWYPDVFIGSWVQNAGFAGYIFNIIEKIGLKLPVDKYIAISNSTKNKLIKNGVSEKKIKIIYCGVDFTEIGNINHDGKKYDICAVGRLLAYKRFDDLIRVVSILKIDFPRISLCIVGQGPERKKLEVLVKELNLGNHVTFLGYLPSHKDVLEIMASSCIFCLPSQAEGFGISVIEAMALGVPAVVSNIPALVEVTDNGQGGLLFETGNATDLSDKIKILLSNDKIYQNKVKEAKQLAAKYNWEKIAEETKNVYLEILKKYDKDRA